MGSVDVSCEAAEDTKGCLKSSLAYDTHKLPGMNVASKGTSSEADYGEASVSTGGNGVGKLMSTKTTTGTHLVDSGDAATDGDKADTLNLKVVSVYSTHTAF